MAVTFHTIPRQWSTSDNPLMFVFSSNQTLQPNFSFIVETLIDSVVVSRDRVFPISTTRAYWDASPKVKTRFDLPVLTTTGSLCIEAGTSANVQIKVIENYGTPAVDQANATSTARDIFKASLSDENWTLQNFNVDWKLIQFLTNAPNNTYLVSPNQVHNLAMICYTTISYAYKFYNASNVEINTLTGSGLVRDIAKFIGSQGLFDSAGVTNYADVVYYTLRVNGSSEVFRFDILRYFCNDMYFVYWMNEYGVYDSFPFYHANTLNSKVDDFGYKKQFGAWDGTDFNFDLTNSGDTTYLKKIDTMGEIVTELLDFETYNWLNEIINSPSVFIANADLSLIKRISVKNTSYNNLDARFDEPESFVLKYAVATNQKSIQL